MGSPGPFKDLPPAAGGRHGSAAAHQRRILARALDLLIYTAFAWAVPPVGAALGLLYVLVADAIWVGQSPGKRLFGVTVLRVPSGTGGTLWTSVMRNLPMAVALVMPVIPIASWLLFPLLGLPLLVLETRLTAWGALGRRLGDFLGDTYVADVWRAPPVTRAEVTAESPPPPPAPVPPAAEA
ncbi:MAG: RDD family protein [Deltaproteobacteria bacterium]|nr:RDD family protein [Deltaproteobacteria bacterium]